MLPVPVPPGRQFSFSDGVYGQETTQFGKLN
jgi:hypothetical protein